MSKLDLELSCSQTCSYRGDNGQIFLNKCIKKNKGSGYTKEIERFGDLRCCFIIIFFNVYLFLRECVRVHEQRRERIPSRLHTVSAEPRVALKPTNREIRT